MQATYTYGSRLLLSHTVYVQHSNAFRPLCNGVLNCIAHCDALLDRFLNLPCEQFILESMNVLIVLMISAPTSEAAVMAWIEPIKPVENVASNLAFSRSRFTEVMCSCMSSLYLHS